MDISFLTVIILGIVEGLTEFIPVSSTGHLILVGHWLDFKGDEASSFKIFIQLGAICAVLLFYWKRFCSLVTEIFNLEEYKSQLNWTHILLCILPAMVAGFFAYPYIKTYLFSPITVSAGLIVGGLFMIFADRITKERELADSLDNITYKQSLLVGIFQCFSLWPGVSRSAATILGGLFSGINHKIAADFSFIVAVPTIFMAICYDLFKNFHLLSISEFGVFILGGITAFTVAYLSLGLFFKLLHQFKLVPFGWYRIFLGIFVLVVL